MAVKSSFNIVLAILAACVFSHAQGVVELAKHPGDVIKYEIKFDGPNADKIKLVNASLGMRVGPPKDQAGFTNGFGVQHEFPPSSPKTFLIEMTVPQNTATGDYFLSVAARADEGSADYSDGRDFNVPSVHIDNPKKFTPPAITVKPL